MQAQPPPRPEGLSLVQLLPNLLTLAALCSGLTAIRFAAQGAFAMAVGLILLAALLDGLDGRVARRIGGESALGAELDSLCDVVSFGVAPALVMYFWAFDVGSGNGWIAALVYAAACALRLARFNIGSRDPLAVAQPKKTFTGVPSPAGAVLVLLPLHVAHVLPDAPIPPVPLLALWMVFVAALMVSRLPTPAFVTVSIPPAQARLLLLGLVGAMAALIVHPWLTLVVVDVGYLLLLLRGWVLIRRRHARKDG